MVNLRYGNCLDIMKEIKDNSIDMILCDLPYGNTKCSWDIIIPFEQLWEQYNRIIKDNGVIALFGNEPFSSYLRLSNIKNYKYDIYWEKERLTNITQVKKRVGKTIETISIFYKKQCTYNPQMIKYEGPLRTNKIKDGKLGLLTDNQQKKVVEYKDTGFRYPTQVWKYKRDCLTNNFHPTQKPIKLLENLIKTFTNENDLVLDPFMGSGSTGKAVMFENKERNANYKFIGIEREKEYCDIAEARIKWASKFEEKQKENNNQISFDDLK